MAGNTEDRNEGSGDARRPMAPQPAKSNEREREPHDDGRHPDGEGRDGPPSDRPRGTESPWLGGG